MRRLEQAADRTGVLNRSVALLYSGDAAGAERELLQLGAREPRWTPALRWLARARAASGSPELADSVERLLRAELAAPRLRAAVARVVVAVRSKPGFPLLKIDSRFESLVAEDGSVLAHREREP